MTTADTGSQDTTENQAEHTEIRYKHYHDEIYHLFRSKPGKGGRGTPRRTMGALGRSKHCPYGCTWDHHTNRLEVRMNTGLTGELEVGLAHWYVKDHVPFRAMTELHCDTWRKGAVKHRTGKGTRRQNDDMKLKQDLSEHAGTMRTWAYLFQENSDFSDYHTKDEEGDARQTGDISNCDCDSEPETKATGAYRGNLPLNRLWQRQPES